MVGQHSLDVVLRTSSIPDMSLRQHQKDPFTPVTLHLDGFILCNLDAPAAQEVFRCPEEFAREVKHRLLSSKMLTSPLSRVWIRLTKVPLPCVPANELDCALWRSQGPHLVSFHGVVSSLSTPFAQIYSKILECPHCGATQQVTGAGPPADCCGARAMSGMTLEEDLARRVVISGQWMWVSPLSSATSSGPPASMAVLVLVQDELVGRYHIGSMVQVIGHAEQYAGLGPPASSHHKMFARIKVKANNILPYEPHQRWSLCHPHPLGPSDPYGLHHLLILHQAALSCRLSLHLQLGLLLSAVSVCHHQAPSSTTSYLMQRSQINILCLGEEWCPSTLRLLRQSAALLCPHSGYLSPASSHFGPPVVEELQEEGEGEVVLTGERAKRVHGNAWALASTGIAVLNMSTTTPPKQQRYVDHIMGSTLVDVKDQPTLSSPFTATLWIAMNKSEAAAKLMPEAQGPKSKQLGMNVDRGLDLVVQNVLVDGADVVGQGDLYLRGFTSRDQQCRDNLQHHICKSVLLQPPLLSEGAQDLLVTYQVALRQALVPLVQSHMLEILIKVATASARLHLRAEVMSCPDATLAVLMMDKSLEERFGGEYCMFAPLSCFDATLAERGSSLDQHLADSYRVMVRELKQFKDIHMMRPEE